MRLICKYRVIQNFRVKSLTALSYSHEKCLILIKTDDTRLDFNQNVFLSVLIHSSCFHFDYILKCILPNSNQAPDPNVKKGDEHNYKTL